MRRNFRRSYWLASTFLKKHLKKIGLTAILTILSMVAIPQLAQKIPTGKPTTKIGRVGQFNVNNLPFDILNLIGNGLTSINQDGNPTPGLALEWRVEDEGHRYIFNLNPDIEWHNGDKLQAADIDYLIEDVEFNVLNSQTIEFKLKEPFSPFPTALSNPIFRRTTTLSKVLKRPESQLIGTGDYQVDDVKRRGQHVSELHLESVRDKIIYKFYPTEEAAILGFKLGEINSLENITDASPLEKWKNLNIKITTHVLKIKSCFQHLPKLRK